MGGEPCLLYLDKQTDPQDRWNRGADTLVSVAMKMSPLVARLRSPLVAR
jgi:hypothetical protein